MLESIHLKNVGPAPEMKMNLAPRLNLVTGDNGLGKSFLLDVAWWALTRSWAREMAIPKPGVDAEIEFAFTTKSGSTPTHVSRYQAARQRPHHGDPHLAGAEAFALVPRSWRTGETARR